MADLDVIVAKTATMDRCLQRIEEVRGQRGAAFLPIDADDIVLLNLQRATQSAIDLAVHVVARKQLGVPSSVADSFTILANHGVIDVELATRLRKMVGFRNIAIHAYQEIDPNIVEAIVTGHLGDFRFLTAGIARYLDA